MKLWRKDRKKEFKDKMKKLVEDVGMSAAKFVEESGVEESSTLQSGIDFDFTVPTVGIRF